MPVTGHSRISAFHPFYLFRYIDFLKKIIKFFFRYGLVYARIMHIKENERSTDCRGIGQ